MSQFYVLLSFDILNVIMLNVGMLNVIFVEGHGGIFKVQVHAEQR